MASSASRRCTARCYVSGPHHRPKPTLQTPPRAPDNPNMPRTRTWTASLAALAAYTLGAWSAESTARASAHAVPATPGVQAQDAGPADAHPLQCTPQDMCCRVCTKGKACGDSCISAGKSCHKGRGCACDAAELCE